MACYDTDISQSLKPASFMDYAQEIGGQHVDVLGIGYDALIPNRRAWVILRMRMVFIRQPHWRDVLTISTWHRCMDGPFYVRDYELSDADGEPLVKSTSSWIICDLDERKFVRTPEIQDSLNDYIPSDSPMPVCKRLRVPETLALNLIGEHKVSYSDVDKNVHANNARYVQWVMDAIDPGFISEHPVRELEINFNHEARLGQVVSLFGAAYDDSVWYVVGRIDGEDSFVTKIIFYV